MKRKIPPKTRASRHQLVERLRFPADRWGKATGQAAKEPSDDHGDKIWVDQRLPRPQLQAGTVSNPILGQYDRAFLPDRDQGLTQCAWRKAAVNFRVSEIARRCLYEVDASDRTSHSL